MAIKDMKHSVSLAPQVVIPPPTLDIFNFSDVLYAVFYAFFYVITLIFIEYLTEIYSILLSYSILLYL